MRRTEIPKTVLITGSSRGIGLEFARQYAEAGWKVVACCRDREDSSELYQLKDTYNAVSIRELDVTDQQQVQALANTLKDQPIDLLINNAGLGDQQCGGLGYQDSSTSFDDKEYLRVIAVNTIGPITVTNLFEPNILKGSYKAVVAISSHLGSGRINDVGGTAYCISKAALNRGMKRLSVELAEKGIKVLILHPGSVQTSMGGPEAQITAEESVTGMRKQIDNVTIENTGQFKSYDGSILVW